MKNNLIANSSSRGDQSLWHRVALTFRLLLKGALYLAALLLLPGALLGAPLLWWLERRRTRGNSVPLASEMNKAGRHCAGCA